jgi:superfamily II DNA or RNA helicase
MTATITLRDYQQTACHTVLNAWRSGVRRTLISLPAGASKTVVFGNLIKQTTNKNRRALVLAHTEELVDQAARTLRTLLPGVRVGVVRGQHDETDSHLIVVAVQTLRSGKRLRRIGRFSVIVIDKAHHANAQAYRDILLELDTFDAARRFPLVLGVTATADRRDGRRLAEAIQDHASGRKCIVFLPTVDKTAEAINAVYISAPSVSGLRPSVERQQIVDDVCYVTHRPCDPMKQGEN